MTLAPWDYLFLSFNSRNFPDLFHPTWIAPLVLLVALTVLYNVRTRALHRHQPYLDLWEWLWWTGLITFSLLIIESLFVFDFFLVLLTRSSASATLVWIRFLRFPPILARPRAAARPRALLHASRSSPTPRRRSGGAAAAARQRRRRRATGRVDADRDPPVRRRPPPAGRAARHDRA